MFPEYDAYFIISVADILGQPTVKSQKRADNNRAYSPTKAHLQNFRKYTISCPPVYRIV